MKCIKCGSENVNVQIIPVNKRGHYTFKVFWQTLMMYSPMLAILLLLPLIGWAILAIMYLRGYKITSEEWSVCQNCGYREKI